jgi:hypothetical protein
MRNQTVSKKIQLLVALIATFTFGLPAIASAIPATVNLTVHYQRPGNDYQDWNLWLWKNLNSGADVDVDSKGVTFTADDAFGKIAFDKKISQLLFGQKNFIIKVKLFMLAPELYMDVSLTI